MKKNNEIIKYCARIKKPVNCEFCEQKCRYFFDTENGMYIKCFWSFSKLPVYKERVNFVNKK